MHDRPASLLGATPPAVTDLMLAAATRAAGVGVSGAAALVILADDPRLSVTELGRCISLTQSAAARMVDSLTAAGLAQRHGTAGRAVGVRLTAPDVDAAGRLLAARAEPLADLLSDVDDTDRERLAERCPRCW
ncbi:MarR family winged helix-turn-helix transcriptional regulator [Actinophytocola sp.]|uniref:MarR family winged helix-turn-helix transcriptional regulator n=1 Tax=Actinophytocola sp. TaxID=1872138 RepID=UPI0025BD56DB|nr:MarR family transcriptional regulator [Actinophytocola sp.]